MKPEQLLRLLHPPHTMTPEEVASLQDLLRQYPYFQAVYVLLAKAAYDQNPATARPAIQQAAIYATNRSHLKALLEDELPFAAPALAPHEPQAPPEEETQADAHAFINPYINTIRQKAKRPITKQKSLAQLHIIQDFMQKDVHFKPQRLSEISAKDLQSDLTQQSTSLHDDLITENLAQVLVQQGKLERALDIYAQLLLRFPEKKAYFATLIEKLKRQC